MLRTRKEWYNMLSPQNKVRFNCNLKVENYLTSKEKVSADEFLYKAFYWSTTPEKHDYWSKIKNELLKPLI